MHQRVHGLIALFWLLLIFVQYLQLRKPGSERSEEVNLGLVSIYQMLSCSWQIDLCRIFS